MDSSHDAAEMEVDEPEIDAEGSIRIGDIYIGPPPRPACSFDNTGPRLMIWQIVNEFFKSYAGKQVLGPFHKRFSGIIGPNGSGKSNVIDAMLFVFGYRAQRIRSKKVSTLIHNSAKHPDVNSCTVSVHFQKIIDLSGDDYDIVPGSTFVVARTAFKDNSSYYTMNGKRVQFREVAAFLRSQGIDLDHNRFLILQGEVEQIAMMKPKGQTEHDTGMLEFLEDIVGSSRFKVPIEMLNGRVNDLNVLRSEKVNRVKLIEQEKNALEEPMTEALNYIRKENDIVLKKNILYQRYIHEFDANIKTSLEKKQKFEEDAHDLLSSLNTLQSKCKEKELEQKTLHKDLEKVNKNIDEKKAEYAEMEKQDYRFIQDIKHAKSKAKKLVQTLAAEKEKLKELNDILEKDNELENLSKKCEKLEDKKKEEDQKLAKVLASLHSETKPLQDEKDKHEAHLIQLKEVVDEAKSKMAIATSEYDIYICNEDNEKRTLTEMEKNIESSTNTLKDRERLVKDLKKNIPNLQQTLTSDQASLERTVKEESDAVEQARTMRHQVEEARNSVLTHHARGKLQETLMKAKNSGQLPGIVGRLGDLGAIDAKYDVAISTACGQLEFTVVDTMTTALQSVELLKKTGSGRTTFICLDKMQQWVPYTKSKISTPENVPRLFDLVKVKDDRYLPAFYFALRDTLVAKDIDQATRIAFHGTTRYRVVTLIGQLIDISGTMSGGGTKVIKGRMGQSVRVCDFTTNQLEEMEVKLRDLSQLAASLGDAKHKLEEKVELQNKELDQMQLTLKKFCMDIDGISGQLASLATQIKEQKKKVDSTRCDPVKVKALQHTRESADQEYKIALNSASGVETVVQKLHAQIMEITGGRVQVAQKKVDDISKKIDENKAEVMKIKVAVKSAKRKIEMGEAKVKSTEIEISDNKTSFENIEKQLKSVDENAKIILEELNKLTAMKDASNEKIVIVKKELRTLQEEEAKLNTNKLEFDHQLEMVNHAVKNNQTRGNTVKRELQQLKLQEIENEEIQELKKLSEEELIAVDSEGVQYHITVLEQELSQIKPNKAVIAEYRAKNKVFLQRVAELQDVTKQRDDLRQNYDKFRKQRLDEFMEGFATISYKLKESYQMLTLGGDAELELVDSLDPFSEGIAFSVRPPKKSWNCISNLSGGEKTLSSLALVFALHYYRPTPLYVMDEIDAALDFRNVTIVAHYIKERTKNAQFIIVSLRNNMFELSDRLVGIYKTYDCTKSATIDPGKIGMGSMSPTDR